MKQRVKEMEAEAAKLREMQAQAEKDMNMAEEGIYLDYQHICKNRGCYHV